MMFGAQAMLQSIAKRIDVVGCQGCRLTIKGNEANYAWKLENLKLVGGVDARKNVAGEQDQIQFLPTVLPLAQGMVNRQEMLDPALVSPALLVLAGDDAPTRAILCAGAGHFARASITLSTGRYIGR